MPPKRRTYQRSRTRKRRVSGQLNGAAAVRYTITGESLHFTAWKAINNRDKLTELSEDKLLQLELQQKVIKESMHTLKGALSKRFV